MIRGFNVDRASEVLDAINHAEEEQADLLDSYWGHQLLTEVSGQLALTLAGIHQIMLEAAQRPTIDDESLDILYRNRWDLYETDEDRGLE